MSAIEIEAERLARIIREQTALPISAEEADRLARALESSTDDAELLANALSAIRLLVDRLEDLGGDQPAADRSR